MSNKNNNKNFFNYPVYEGKKRDSQLLIVQCDTFWSFLMQYNTHSFNGIERPRGHAHKTRTDSPTEDTPQRDLQSSLDNASLVIKEAGCVWYWTLSDLQKGQHISMDVNCFKSHIENYIFYTVYG